MFIFFPIGVDVPFERIPWMNWLIILATVIAFPFGLQEIQSDSKETSAVIAGSGHAIGHLAHLFVHAGIIHLLGNMIFLWAFGNAVCAKLGNFTYLLAYLGIGVLSSVVTHAMWPRLSIGASGAINGVVGMYIVWYALNEVRVVYAYWLFMRGDAGDADVDGYWLIIGYFAWDLVGMFFRTGSTDHLAHVGGFVMGFVLAFGLTQIGFIKMRADERSLLDLWRESRTPMPAPKPRTLSVPNDAAPRAAHAPRTRHIHDDAPIPLDDSPIPIDDASNPPKGPPSSRPARKDRPAQ